MTATPSLDPARVAAARTCCCGTRLRATTTRSSSLAAACPMRGDIELCMDRSPDFFALSRLEGDRSRVGVVSDWNGARSAASRSRRGRRT